MRSSIRCLATMVALAIILAAFSANGQNRVRLDVAVGSPVLLANRTQTVFLKVGLTGAPLAPYAQRTPVNVALVLDRSGSMAGDKIAKVREAAILAVDRLGPEDIVSIVAYNHTVNVLVPATKVRDRQELYRQINTLFASGNTALFAGVSKGAYEVRKFLDRNRVNRVILLSDGLANVGPSSPGELASLGWSLAREGISVTTIGLGLGYNEDLMVELARASDGNHAFAASGADLSRIFALEFGDVLSVVAREVIIEIHCQPGVRPIRVLGRQAEIQGGRVVTTLGQVYANQEKYVLLEVEVPASAAGSTRELAAVSVRYADPISRTTDAVASKALVVFSDSPALVERSQNKVVLETSVEAIGNDNNRAALMLRDQGKVEEAREALRANAAFLESHGAKYQSPKLKALGTRNFDDSNHLDDESWTKQRKAMRKQQYELDSQQAW